MIPLTRPQRSRSLLKLRIMKQTFYSVLVDGLLSFVSGGEKKSLRCQSLHRDCKHSHMRLDWHGYYRSAVILSTCCAESVTKPDTPSLIREKKVTARIYISSSAQSHPVKATEGHLQGSMGLMYAISQR